MNPLPGCLRKAWLSMRPIKIKAELGLLRAKSESLGHNKRLILTGYDVFRRDHEQVHQLMVTLKIPHEYRDEKKAKHTWDAGWIEDSVRFLIDAAKK